MEVVRRVLQTDANWRTRLVQVTLGSGEDNDLVSLQGDAELRGLLNLPPK